MDKIRILLVGIGDFSTGFQSGRPRALYREVAAQYEVHTLQLPGPKLIYRALGAADRAVGLGTTLSDRQRRLREGYFRRLKAEAQRLSPDVVISTTTLPFTDRMMIPTVAWPDAPLNLMIEDEAYPALVALHRRTKESYLHAEMLALSNVHIAAMPSAVGTEATRKLAPKSRALRAPFGPNLNRTVLNAALARRSVRSENRIKQALFIGLDWRRKGGDVAVEAIQELNRRRVPSELVIIGRCPSEVASLPHVRYAGELDNSSQSGLRKFLDNLVSADALIFPTRADNYGAVVVESAAIGLPVVASSRAGASEYVSEHLFGHRVPDEHVGPDEITAYADALEALFADPTALETASQAGIHAHQSTLNYLTSTRRILDATD